MRPCYYTGLGGVFCSFSSPHPRPGPDRTHPLDRPPFFTTRNLRGPVWGMAGVGPWPGVWAGRGEKSAPARSGKGAGTGPFAGGRVLCCPGGPVTNTT